MDIDVIKLVTANGFQNDVGGRMGGESQETNAAVFLEFPGGGDAAGLDGGRGLLLLRVIYGTTLIFSR